MSNQRGFCYGCNRRFKELVGKYPAFCSDCEEAGKKIEKREESSDREGKDKPPLGRRDK